MSQTRTIHEGFQRIGCELTPEYWPFTEGRVKHAEVKVAETVTTAA